MLTVLVILLCVTVALQIYVFKRSENEKNQADKNKTERLTAGVYLLTFIGVVLSFVYILHWKEELLGGIMLFAFPCEVFISLIVYLVVESFMAMFELLITGTLKEPM